jgi:hypothetical protein
MSNHAQQRHVLSLTDSDARLVLIGRNDANRCGKDIEGTHALTITTDGEQSPLLSLPPKLRSCLLITNRYPSTAPPPRKANKQAFYPCATWYHQEKG